MDAIHHAAHERFHFVLADAGYLIPRYFPAFRVNYLHIV